MAAGLSASGGLCLLTYLGMSERQAWRRQRFPAPWLMLFQRLHEARLMEKMAARRAVPWHHGP